MRWLSRLLYASGVLALAGGAVASAQTAPPPVPFDTLRETAPPSAPAREWLVTLGVSAAPDAVAALPSPPSRELSAARVRERNPQLSEDSIVIAAVDQSGRTLDWQIVTDPRIVRAESPGPDGRLSGRTLARDRVEFSAVLNAGDDAAQLVIYKPRWRGSDWLLEPIATARTR